ncbi:MAG: MFS transporter [Candidatus Lokiarchaeota archaeon]|nr:MFS transporter [Candidatus Lokiarchaeota archaeon]
MILSKKSIILILFSVFIINTAAIIVYTYVPKYLLFLGIEKPLMQLIITIFPLTAFIFPPLYGFYSDKIQNRYKFILFGSIGITIAYFFLLLTQNLILIVVLIFLFGFFMASSNLLITLFAELVEDDKTLISYFNASVVAGWFVGAQFGGIYIDFYGIEHIFLFIFLISLPNVIVVVFIKEKRSLILERYNREVEKNAHNLVLNNEEEISISQSIYYGLFFRNFSIKPIMPILAIIMSFHLGNDTEIGFLIGINFLLQFFQMLLIGKIITNKNIKSFMIIGYTLSSITIFGYIISTNFWSYILFQFLVSFSYSMHWAATITYIAQKTSPKNKGKYMGYANTSIFSGSFVGGLLFSLLLSVFNSDYYIVMYFMIIFPAISTFIIFLKFKPDQTITPYAKKERDSELLH